MNVSDEITVRLRHHDAGIGALRFAPLLVLGTSERVGSNWLSDTLGTRWQQHNEPLRQQLAAEHPLSTENPDPATSLNNMPASGLAAQWLVTFVLGKYGPARQVIKETNLYFTTRLLLELFPDSPLVVASRSPLGVASSFTRADLFARWKYRERYTQLSRVAASPGRSRWAPLLPADDPDDVTALVRLVVTNTLLVAEAVGDRAVVHMPYEQAVLHPDGALPDIGRLLGTEISRPPTPARSPAVDDTFATTTAKNALHAHLTPAAAERVRALTAALLQTARSVVAAPVLARAAGWLSGDHCYQLAPVSAPRRTTRPPQQARTPTLVRWIPDGTRAWRNLLITNTEYAAFLNGLAAAGLSNTHHGVHLLAIPMPTDRGGRLTVDSRGRWTVPDGYGGHPVYWVTWIGAACYAAHAGARLPTRTECDALTRGLPLDQINAAYQHGDTIPAAEPGRTADELHHPVGNLQVWCTDGPTTTGQTPVVRWLHGAAWNTEASPEQVHRLRHRHLLGASRGVGIRLARDGNQRAVSLTEIAATAQAWLDGLDQRDRSLVHLDGVLLTALDRLQADSRLGSHV